MQYTDLEFLGKISCCSVKRTDFLSIKDSSVACLNLFLESSAEGDESLELKVRLLRRRWRIFGFGPGLSGISSRSRLNFCEQKYS